MTSIQDLGARGTFSRADGTPGTIHRLQVLEDAGFRLIAERNRREFATEFFAAVSAGGKGPPPLGLHILMGAARGEKVKNMIENISAGRIAPVELIAEKN